LYPLLFKAAWLVNHKSQPESKADVKRRVKAVLDKILLKCQDDVLIVSHAGLMTFMRKELLNRGFRGPNFKTPDNGKLYVYER